MLVGFLEWGVKLSRGLKTLVAKAMELAKIMGEVGLRNFR